MPQRAVYWPAKRTLLVADLHLGKSDTLASAGIPMPAGVLEHDLARLDAALAATGAERVLVLGDLMHASAGLTPALLEAVGAWRRARAGVRVSVVPGNHDRRLPKLADIWSLEILPARHAEDGFGFVHDPAEAEDRRPELTQPELTWAGLTWAGHLHPLVKLARGGDRMVLPAFWIGRRLGVLPAFSRFTRGTTRAPEPGGRWFAIAPGEPGCGGEGRIVPLGRG